MRPGSLSGAAQGHREAQEAEQWENASGTDDTVDFVNGSRAFGSISLIS